MATTRPSVAVYKFSSCDGCQLSLLNMEDELLDLAGAVDLAFFLEASPRHDRVPTISLWSRDPSRRSTK